MKNFKLLLFLFSWVLFVSVGHAQALLIDPSDAIAYGSETKVPNIQNELSDDWGINLDVFAFLYKSEVDDGKELGPLTNSYTTSYFNDPDDPSEAEIVWDGGQYIDDAYMLVKDGNQDPAWYFFDLGVLGWDGMETLELKNFWPDQGAISHVALYGVSVPEPATMLLLGSGLIGLAVTCRKNFKK